MTKRQKIQEKIFILFIFGLFIACANLKGCKTIKNPEDLQPIVDVVKIYQEEQQKRSGEEQETPEQPETKAPEITPASETITTNDLDCVDSWGDSSDVKNWPVTTLLNVTMDQKNIYFSFDKSNTWKGFKTNPDDPKGKLLAGNLWIIIKKDGKEFAATWEWFKKGGTVEKSKEKLSKDGSGHVKGIGPGWNAVPGEYYGFFVSGRVRDGGRSVKERSQVVWVKWE